MANHFQLDPIAKESSAVRTILRHMTEEREKALEDVGKVRDSESPQRDMLLTAALRGEIRLLQRWIARLSSV